MLIRAQRIPCSGAHNPIDRAAIVAGTSESLLQAGYACLAAIITVTIAGARITASVGGTAVVTLAIAVTGTVTVITRPVWISISIRITPAPWIAPERETKTAYENEIIKVMMMVVVMPIAAPTAIPIAATPTIIPISAAPMAALPRTSSAVNGAGPPGHEMVTAAIPRPRCGHRSGQHHGDKRKKERFRIHSNAESS